MDQKTHQMKVKISILLVICLQSAMSLAQSSPVLWTNNSYTINIDTSANKKMGFEHYNYDYARTLFINYSFKNSGSHLTFIDSILSYNPHNKFITKPNENQTVSIEYSKVDGLNFWKKRDTSIFLLIPFYYEGKIYREKVTCNLTFAKSKLITHDQFLIDTTEWISKIVNADTSTSYPSIKFTHYFTIKNISNAPIYCTKQLIAWNDAQNLRNRNAEYQKILPGETYKIPAQMNMDRKYRFKSKGIIEVFTDEISELYECEINSDFKQSNFKQKEK